jgi:NhaA family Na+:H+ antiporter
MSLPAEIASGLVLVVATLVALVLANSPWHDAYERLIERPLPIGAGLPSLHFWINDGLMAIFFLVVGLEIRRELHEGALASLRLAALPLVAALGGVIVPALVYLALNRDPALRAGWAVPTATDIAFAVGVLALLGSRVPPALRVLLLAIAIIDDIVAVLVIAIFYSTGLSAAGVPAVGIGLVAIAVLRMTGIEARLAWAVPGVALWVGMLQSGVHPALSGVALGLALPVAAGTRLEHALHPWVTFGILPLFALANAGVPIGGLAAGVPPGLVAGIVAGLVLGKPVGIVLAARASVALGWGALPPGIGRREVLVIGLLAGIGFTMSLFICDLAFTGAALGTAKLAVLVASVIAALGGVMLGRRLLPARAA